MTPAKPLGIKAYGSIPHLLGSRLGPGDHHCHAGQAEICMVKKRDRHDSVTVTVKLDGSCVAVAKIDGVILPLGRAGYLAQTSKYEQHQLFFQWAMGQQRRFLELLHDGERVCGEWLAQAHGTRYRLIHEPLVVFDLFREGKRISYAELRDRAAKFGFVMPTLLVGHQAGEPITVEQALEEVATPMHGELDPVEGVVWRVERKSQFDFLAKYVRPEKVDGCYLPEISGNPPVWNWRP